jgi:hypothetical protein
MDGDDDPVTGRGGVFGFHPTATARPDASNNSTKLDRHTPSIFILLQQLVNNKAAYKLKEIE